MTTQSGLALQLYTKNKKISHEEFVAEFLKVFPSQSAKIAALYWQNKARRAKFGLAPVKLPEEYSGKPEKPAKQVSAKKLLKEVGIKLEKPKKNRFTGEVKAEATPKTAEEIAKIKAANLARMKEVHKKYPRISRDAGNPGVNEFDPSEAREEVEEAYRDMDSFVAPRFLSKDQVKALV